MLHHLQMVRIQFTADRNLSVSGRTQMELGAPGGAGCPVFASVSWIINLLRV